MVETTVSPTNGGVTNNNMEALPVVYFAVGPNAHDVTCPFCNVTGKTILKKKILAGQRQHFCSNCREYLGTFRRPLL